MPNRLNGRRKGGGLAQGPARRRYQKRLKEGLRLIFRGIEKLRKLSGGRREFTIDGRLVGDIGEFVASEEYDLTLDETSKPGYDGKTEDGRSVQVKATFQKHLTYRKKCDYYLGLKLNPDGTHEEIYNGPGRFIHQHFAHRKGIGSELLQFPVATLRELSGRIPRHQRIRRGRGR